MKRPSIEFLLKKAKGAIRSLSDRMLRPYFDELEQRSVLAQRSSPALQVALRDLYHRYQGTSPGELPGLANTGFRVFSQFEEDGKLMYIFALLGVARGTFVDIGAGNGINSNCANLAINFGWDGAFIDGNADQLRRGVDLMSIDIDGNDYWVWEAITAIEPKVVIIETHVEFGIKSIVVPYDKDYMYPGIHPDYHGASPVAMAKMAKAKGYRLVGSNDYGFNTIYVRSGLGESVLPEISAEEVLAHPRNLERLKRFEAISHLPYLEA